MITPVPARVDDKKDAVLWSVLNALEQIDNTPSSRGTFAQSILFNLAANLDGPCFREEVRQMKEVLGIKEEEPAPACMVPETEQREPSNEINREDLIMREL